MLSPIVNPGAASDGWIDHLIFSKIQELWDMNTNSFVVPWKTQLQNLLSWKSQLEATAANEFHLDGIALNVTHFCLFINLKKSRSEKPQAKRGFQWYWNTLGISSSY
jgi:hypothetical protein